MPFSRNVFLNHSGVSFNYNFLMNVFHVLKGSEISQLPITDIAQMVGRSTW